jgi:acid phosphatase (class A)
MRRLTTALIAITLAGCSVAQPPAPAAKAPTASRDGDGKAVTPAPRPPGYLTDATAPLGAFILPPAPVKGTDRYEQDRRIFRATRKLEGSDRWKLAQNDNDYTNPALLRDFSCAMGVTMTEQNAPKLAHLISRAIRDSGKVSSNGKDVFLRQRPFHQDKGNICIPHTESFDRSLDYPSGHTTLSWMVGLLLAEAAPDRSTPILVRARAYGESRVVCGVHNASAIEGGRTAGSITVAAQHGSAEFRADLEAMRAEIAALRKSGTAPDAAACKAEAELTAKTPYPY